MVFADIAYARLYNQRLAAAARGAAATPAELVAHLGAAQAQDFAGAKWSLGQRLWPTSDAAIEAAFNRGDILRTHVLRPTWHFVAPADARWLLALTSPRVHRLNRPMYRQLGLDEATLARCGAVIEQALRGGEPLTRDELKVALEAAGITALGGPDRPGQRLAYAVMWAELEGLIISGPRRGKQFTYMLLDERAPHARTMERDEALAELARRYFTSHGPATADDFARWSSLTLTETRAGLDAVAAEFEQQVVDGQTYWFAGDPMPPRDPSPTAHLTSIFDEYTIGYKEWQAIGGEEYGDILRGMGNALQNVILVDGRLVGTWRRDLAAEVVRVELNVLAALTDEQRRAMADAAERYGVFLGRRVVVKPVDSLTLQTGQDSRE